MMKVIILTFCGALALNVAQAAGTTPANAVPSSKILPLALDKLPYAPKFTPNSCMDLYQSFTVKDWHYMVHYVYSPKDRRWMKWGYSAQLLRLPDGTPVLHNVTKTETGIKSIAKDVCTPDNSPPK
ncbi:MAG: hypothetical protein ACRER1_01975 [Gammaproteobacteria bacterium]